LEDLNKVYYGGVLSIREEVNQDISEAHTLYDKAHEIEMHPSY
jgi:hypothetical protein